MEDLKALMIQQPALKHVDSPNKIRLWSRDRLLKKNSLSLKRQNIGSDTSLTVQIIPEGEKEFENNEILLYIHRRLVNANSYGPPMEVRFTQKQGTVNELVGVVSDLLLIPTASLFLAKLNGHNGKWIALEPEQTNKSVQTSGSNSNASSSKPVSQAKAKFHLKDGDVIVAKDKREDPANEDDFSNNILQDPSARKQNRLGGPGAKGKPKATRVKEVGIHIEVNI